MLRVGELPGAARTDSGNYLISVLVSSYNAAQLLRACLQDLEAQTIAGQMEIIVIDSGSEQDEAAVAAEFQRRYGNLRYLRTERRETLYTAWNRGLEAARGRYITNANTDDAHHPCALERLVDALERDLSVDLAYGDCLWTDVANDCFDSTRASRSVRYPDYEPRLGLLYCLLGPHPVWRRSVFARIGGFDGALRAAGDYEFQLRFIAGGLRAVHVPELLSVFYQNRGGLTLASDVSRRETAALNQRYRTRIPIERLYAVDPRDGSAVARAWVAQGNLAADFTCPWEELRQSDPDYAVACFQRALVSDPCCAPAVHNLIRVAAKAGNWIDCERLLQAAGTVPEDIVAAVRARRVPRERRVEAEPLIMAPSGVHRSAVPAGEVDL